MKIAHGSKTFGGHMRTRLHAALNLVLGVALISLGAQSASASPVTISGVDLSYLTYRPSGGTAEYQAGPPAVAYLATTDSGLNGAAPVVYVRAANVAPLTMGTLSGLSASYVLASSSTPAGTQPYWLTYLYDTIPGEYVGVVSFGGPDLNGSSLVHVFCGFTSNANCTSALTTTTWGDTLSMLDSTTYGSTTFGQMAVYETGVEIGNWNNGSDGIAASASIQSITLFSESVPEPGSLPLVALCLAGLGFIQRRRK